MSVLLAALLAAGSARAAAPEPAAEPAADALPLPDATPRARTRPRAERFDTTAFRAYLASDGGGVGTRIALVQDFDGPTIGEITLRGHYAWYSFSLAVETAATAGASPLWSGAGFGNTVIDVRGVFGRGSTHAIGLRGTFATGDRRGPLGPIAWWGTVPLATVPSNGLALAYDGAAPRWVWHVHAGLHFDPFYAYAYVLGVFDVNVLIATVQPVAERWDLVFELEGTIAPSPIHVRGLARRDLGDGWTADVGLAVPLTGMILDPSLQVLGQIDRRW